MPVDPLPPQRTINVREIEKVTNRLAGSNDALLKGCEFRVHDLTYGR